MHIRSLRLQLEPRGPNRPRLLGLRTFRAYKECKPTTGTLRRIIRSRYGSRLRLFLRACMIPRSVTKTVTKFCHGQKESLKERWYHSYFRWNFYCARACEDSWLQYLIVTEPRIEGTEVLVIVLISRLIDVIACFQFLFSATANYVLRATVRCNAHSRTAERATTAASTAATAKIRDELLVQRPDYDTAQPEHQ